MEWRQKPCVRRREGERSGRTKREKDREGRRKGGRKRGERKEGSSFSQSITNTTICKGEREGWEQWKKGEM